MIGLGIDAGGSSTRWLLCKKTSSQQIQDNDMRVLAKGKAEAITGHVAQEEQRRIILDRLTTMLAEIFHTAKPECVVAGITGLSAYPEAKSIFQQTIAQQCQLSLEHVTLYDDITLAYLSAFAPGEGVVVYGGTGSIAYHLQADGQAIRTGGYGYLIDDAGGGFWIGRTALSQVLRQSEVLQQSEVGASTKWW